MQAVLEVRPETMELGPRSARRSSAGLFLSWLSEFTRLGPDHRSGAKLTVDAATALRGVHGAP